MNQGKSKHIRTGRMRAIAVTSAKRGQSTPGLPTIAVAGRWGKIARQASIKPE